MSKVAKKAAKQKAVQKQEITVKRKLLIQKQMWINIRNLREDAQLRPSELGQHIKATAGNISAIESGKSQCNVEMLLSICAILGCTPNDIFPPVPAAVKREKTIYVFDTIKWE